MNSCPLLILTATCWQEEQHAMKNHKFSNSWYNLNSDLGTDVSEKETMHGRSKSAQTMQNWQLFPFAEICLQNSPVS